MYGKFFLRHKKLWYVGKKFLTPKMVQGGRPKKISGKKNFFQVNFELLILSGRFKQTPPLKRVLENRQN
jgi:hypothetical protein